MTRFWKFILFIGGLLPIIRLFEEGVSSILIFSIFVVVFLWKGLQNVFAKLPLPHLLYYLILGTLLGGLTQLFVQLEGFEKTFSPDPIAHFFQALTIYFWVTVVWYFLLKKFDFSTWSIFWVTGAWGVVVEAIIIYGALSPLVWLFIFLVYGSYAALPYLLTKDKFAVDRRRPTLKTHLAAFALLVLALLMAKVSILVMAIAGIK